MSNLQRLLNMASKALDKNGQSSNQSNGQASNGQASNGQASNGSGKTDWRDMVRMAADKVTGDGRPQDNQGNQNSQGYAAPRAATPASAPVSVPQGTPEDRAAIARYDYLLKTAAPEQLEQVHRDAFARLTPAQREQIDAQLRADLPAGEQPASSDPADLARAATRGEAHNPGFLKKLLNKPGLRGAAGGAAGFGVGAVAGAGLGAAGGLLAAVAGGAVLSAVAAPLLEQAAGFGVDFENLAGGFEGDLEGMTGEAGDFASGIGDQVSDFGSNFEIPGLGSLGGLFGRD